MRAAEGNPSGRVTKERVVSIRPPVGLSGVLSPVGVARITAAGGHREHDREAYAVSPYLRLWTMPFGPDGLGFAEDATTQHPPSDPEALGHDGLPVTNLSLRSQEASQALLRPLKVDQGTGLRGRSRSFLLPSEDES